MTDPAIQAFIESMLSAAEQELQLARECNPDGPAYAAHFTASIICSRIAASYIEAKKALKEKTNDPQQSFPSQLFRS